MKNTINIEFAECNDQYFQYSSIPNNCWCFEERAQSTTRLKKADAEPCLTQLPGDVDDSFNKSCTTESKSTIVGNLILMNHASSTVRCHPSNAAVRVQTVLGDCHLSTGIATLYWEEMSFFWMLH